MCYSQHHYKRSQYFTNDTFSGVNTATPGIRQHCRLALPIQNEHQGGMPAGLRQGFGLSNTPAQQLCLSPIWLLEELGRDFHLAVVF